MAEPLQAAGALTLVETPEALASALAHYFANPQLALQVGQAGREVIHRHTGALARTLEGLEALLPR